MPDILIGNVKGEKGETGATNKVIASVYEFAIGEDEKNIPSGGWASNMPEASQGDYVWCRNTLTWQAGTDSVLYAVGYIGKDGSFNGDDLVSQMQQSIKNLEERITPISRGGTEASTLPGAQAKLGITAISEDLSTFKTEADTKYRKVADKIDTDDIEDEAVGSEKIPSNAITAAKIATGAVTTVKINDKAVTENKLADAVTRRISDLEARDYPVGFRIYSKKQISPQNIYGGTWEYDSTNHGFAGLYIYTKTAS